MPPFSLDDFLERHRALELPTNLDAYFAAPERAGTLLELPLNLPEPVVAEISNALCKLDFNRYPAREAAALRTEIAERLRLPPSHTVLLGNGGLELIDLVLQGVGHGATMLTLDPDFFMFRRSAAKHGLKVHAHRLEPDFALDTSAFRRKLAETAPDLLLFSNPHNPTSVLFPPCEVERLIAHAPGLVLLDEIYAPFAPEPDAALRLLERHPNLIILRSFSKVGAAAIRLGYLIGHAKVLERFSAWQRSFAVGSLALLAGRAILRHAASTSAAVRQVTEDRDAFIADMQALPEVEALPSRTNFVVARFKGLNVAELHDRLAERGVKTVPLAGAPALAHCLRFGVDSRKRNALTLEHLAAVLRTP
jgi:histidinol-phosphate aminotransferase